MAASTFNESILSSGYWEDCGDSLDYCCGNNDASEYQRLKQKREFDIVSPRQSHRNNFDINNRATPISCRPNVSTPLQPSSIQPNCRYDDDPTLSTWSLSDGDSTTSLVEFSVSRQPATRFEAALRRVDFKQCVRRPKVSSALPDWGSPILNSNHDVELEDCEPDEYSQSPQCDTNNVRQHPWSTSPNRCIPSSMSNGDVCKKVEQWLVDRPQWLYEGEKNEGLQLCFLASSAQSILAREKEEEEEEDKDSSSTCGKQLDPYPLTIEGEEEFLMPVSPIPPMRRDHDHVVMPRQPEKGTAKPLSEHVLKMNEIDTQFTSYLERRIATSSNQKLKERFHNVLKINRARRLEIDIALLQIPRLLEVSRPRTGSSPLIESSTAKSIGLGTNDIFCLSRPVLSVLDHVQLECIKTTLQSKILGLNSVLMQLLQDRDELYLQNGGRLVELGDLFTFVREACLVSLSRYNNKPSSRGRMVVAAIPVLSVSHAAAPPSFCHRKPQQSSSSTSTMDRKSNRTELFSIADPDQPLLIAEADTSSSFRKGRLRFTTAAFKNFLFGRLN